MNNIYLITTAVEQNHTPDPLLSGRFCIITATELQAAAIALAVQPDNTYIFSIEVYLSQECLQALNSNRSASLTRSQLRCESMGSKRKRQFYKQKTSQE